jgi:D-arabinose 1-dehydrogenase-like Zn-dependent alcohol dehydrogenase
LDHDGNIAVDPWIGGRSFGELDYLTVSSHPVEMKAVLLDAPGPPSSLRIGELADPVPSPDEVLVRVQAASLNPVDFKVAAIGSELWTYPHVLGVDAAGVIEQVGGNVTDWRPGDRVLYHTTWRRHGTYAELSTVPGHTIAKIPESVSYVDAAAIPCAGLTAYNSLYRRLHCKSGDLVLVHGGNGGVGGFAIQLAKQLGATVVTTCSAANADHVRDLGAEEVIDHRSENVFDGLDKSPVRAFSTRSLIRSARGTGSTICGCWRQREEWPLSPVYPTCRELMNCLTPSRFTILVWEVCWLRRSFGANKRIWPKWLRK